MISGNTGHSCSLAFSTMLRTDGYGYVVKHYPSWISPSIRKLMKNRDHYRRKAKKSGSDADWSEYRVLRNAVTNAMRTAKLAYLEKMLGEAKSSKKMWKQVTREVGGTKQQITEVQYGGNTLT